MVWKDCWIIVDVVVNCAMLWKWSSPHYFCEHVITLFWDRVVTSFMCIEKEWEIKRMYHFEGHFALRDEYYILRNVSHAAMETIFREKYGASQCLLLSRVVSHASIDACKDMSPMCPGLRNSGCVSLGHTCIIILDIVFHCIAHTYH